MAGWLRVDPRERDAYVAECREAVALARSTPGCLDFSITADTLDDGLVLVHERWDDEVALLAFRASGPDDEQRTQVLDAHVRRYEIGGEGPA